MIDLFSLELVSDLINPMGILRHRRIRQQEFIPGDNNADNDDESKPINDENDRDDAPLFLSSTSSINMAKTKNIDQMGMKSVGSKSFEQLTIC